MLLLVWSKIIFSFYFFSRIQVWFVLGWSFALLLLCFSVLLWKLSSFEKEDKKINKKRHLVWNWILKLLRGKVKEEFFFVNPLQRCTRLVIVWIPKQTDSLPNLKLIDWINWNMCAALTNYLPINGPIPMPK